MPSHQERREPLPKGYQFGDGSKPVFPTDYEEAINALLNARMPTVLGCGCKRIAPWLPDSYDIVICTFHQRQAQELQGLIYFPFSGRAEHAE